jgi:hypothetical protein
MLDKVELLPSPLFVLLSWLIGEVDFRSQAFVFALILVFDFCSFISVG